MWSAVFVHLATWPSVMHDKNFSIEHYRQNFQPDFLILSVFIVSVDLYILPSSFSFTFFESHKVGRKQNYFLAHCSDDKANTLFGAEGVQREHPDITL